MGMAGKVFAFNDYSVSVGFQGLNAKCTVPRNILKGGPVLWNTWTVQGHDIDFRIAPRNTKDLDMGNQFPKAVHAFLSALKDTNFPNVEGYLSIIGQNAEKVDSITKRMVAGVRDAGLLDVLNMPNFTVQDIGRNASLTIGSNTASQRSGVYLRIYTTKVGYVYEIQTYVGKSKNFATRYQSVTGPSGEKHEPKHWELHHNENVTVVWVALCILDDMPDALLHLTEQVLVSLLETCRSDIIAPGPADFEKLWLSVFIANASYMSAAAHVAQQASMWPGATISRPQQYGAAKGMNLQSPMFEISRDRIQLIRQDSYHQVASTKEVLRIANFRRTIPRKANWNRLAKSKDMQVIAWFNISWQDVGTKSWTPASTETDETVAAGVEVPGRDTLYATVFEVQLDGKPHPMSFMRGPKVPIFVNSEIADSWALRIEWKDPNGVFRSRYIQPTGTHFNYNVPNAARGQSEHYLRCISMIHHLFNAPYQDLRSAYFNMGAANVLQAHHDYFLQEISFGPQTPYPNTIDYSRVSDARQIQLMKGYGLQKVNIAWSNRPTAKRSVPQKCDSCVLEAEKAVKSHMSCEQKAGVPTNVCEHCYDTFGRAACSFTPNQRWRDHEDEAFKARYRPLLHLPERVPASIQTRDPELQLIPSIEEDEISDGELDM
jgi:hypothetical protein